MVVVLLLLLLLFFGGLWLIIICRVCKGLGIICKHENGDKERKKQKQRKTPKTNGRKRQQIDPVNVPFKTASRGERSSYVQQTSSGYTCVSLRFYDHNRALTIFTKHYILSFIVCLHLSCSFQCLNEQKSCFWPVWCAFCLLTRMELITCGIEVSQHNYVGKIVMHCLFVALILVICLDEPNNNDPK